MPKIQKSTKGILTFISAIIINLVIKILIYLILVLLKNKTKKLVNRQFLHIRKHKSVCCHLPQIH